MSSQVRIQSITAHGWDAYELNVGNLSVIFAPSIGGRIISLKFCKEEFLFVQKDHAGETFSHDELGTTGMTQEELDAKKRTMGFRVWGGDKTWVAPQANWREAIPPLSLDAGKYKIEIQGTKVYMQSPIDPETGLQITREIILHANNRLELKQGLHNRSKTIISCGIWDVTQILRNIYVYVPVLTKEIIPYPEEGNSVDLLGEIISSASEKWSRIRCDEAVHFKYGAKPKEGRIITLKPSTKKNGFLIMERFFSVDNQAKYAHNAIVEVYNSPNMSYAEVEVHAPFQKLQPDESTYHNQEWNFRHIERENLRDIIEDK